MSTSQLEKRVRFLTIYVIAITAICGFRLITSFRQTADSRRTDELTVKRINVVAENGQLRMVISNEHRQHPGGVNGKQWSRVSVPQECSFLMNWEMNAAAILQGTGMLLRAILTIRSSLSVKPSVSPAMPAVP